MNFGIVGNLASFSTSSTAVTFDKIDAEIRNGLRNEQKRLDAARMARNYYEGCVEAYQTDYVRLLGIRDDIPNRRHIPFVRSIVNALVRRMYMGDPKRTIVDYPDATEYLGLIYSKARLTSKIKDSMKFAALGRVCAIQVELNQPKDETEAEATLSMTRPAVNFRLWSADEFVVWCSPDDPLTPYAVAVIDRYDQQTRVRLWTPEVVAVYTSKKWGSGAETMGTRVFSPLSDPEPNFLGVVPFAFTWWTEPTKDFWSWSPGDELVRINEEANARLSKIADDTIFTRPITFSRNVREGWKPPDRYPAGDVVNIPAAVETIGEGIFEPSIDTTIADLSYLRDDRDELNAYLDMQAELHGVPKEQWRNQPNSASSGVAILSEALPVIEANEERQVLMESTERDLAALTLMVISNWIGPEKMPEVSTALANFDLSIKWPPLTKNRPGPDYDQHIQFEIVNGLVSPIQALQELDGVTEEEAIEHFEKKAEHERILASLAPEPEPMPVTDPNQTDPAETEAEDGEEPTEENIEDVE